MAKKERQSNIELLRILAIGGVIILHYNNPSGGGGISYAAEGSLNFYTLYLLESLFVCAVDLFMLISGYFMCGSKKRSLWKPIELIVQVIVFREAIYLGKAALGFASFSVKSAVGALIPANYFVILYCVVYMLSPYINVMLDKLSEKSFRTLVIILVCLFSVYPTVVDVLGEIRGDQFIGLSSIGMYGSQWGYSIVNFLLMYLLGAYLKKGNAGILKWNSGKLTTLLFADVLLMVCWARVNDYVGFFTERSAWEYCSPLVICSAVMLFILFSRINLGVNKAVNSLAEGVFTVFLLHNVFLSFLQIEKFVTGNALVMILHILLSVVLVYAVCWGVYLIYHKITESIYKVLSYRIKLPVIDAES